MGRSTLFRKLLTLLSLQRDTFWTKDMGTSWPGVKVSEERQQPLPSWRSDLLFMHRSPVGEGRAGGSDKEEIK